MTVFKFFTGNNCHIIGFSISGHSGYAESGSDIVCAAISSCTGFLETGLTLLLGKHRGSFVIKTNKSFIKYLLPVDISDEEKEKAFLLTDAFYTYIKQLERNYTKHIYVVKRRLNHVEN